ncbi:MAG: hypothetical protein A3F13_02010 [Gammaproteobacteria bacterium RIFCSPHIGHO2_12_FULL_40_19]|nr:MAG: hypothetical protein A3F13_02010 [Gammaproteobacteria bacterium RIFCSPHIGHO2_12_FULL_40_19]
MTKLGRFLKILCIRFMSDLCPMRAASLTFTTLLSVVPLLMFVFYVLSFFPLLHNPGKALETFILNHFVASSAIEIMHQLQSFVINLQAMSWRNIATLLFIAMLMIFNMVDAVNGIWHVTFHRNSVLSFIFYFITLCIAPIFFTILLLISSYLTSLPLLSHVVEIDIVRQFFLFLSPVLIEWAVFSLFHWVMPSCRVYFRYAVIAGLITMILFEIAKWGFVQYLHFFPTYQWVYGALASIPIFFIWIYVSWLILILGALICNLLQTKVYLSENVNVTLN